MMLNQTGLFSTTQVAPQQGDRQQAAMASHKISRRMTALTPPLRDTHLGHRRRAGAVDGGDRHFSLAPVGAGQAPVLNISPPTQVGIRLDQGGMGWVSILPDL